MKNGCFFIFLIIVICILVSSILKRNDDLQNVENKYLKKMDSLQVELNTIKREKQLLNDSIDKLTTGIENKDEEYTELRTTLQTGKEKLTKIQSQYETLNIYQDYPLDSIRSFFRARFGAGQR